MYIRAYSKSIRIGEIRIGPFVWTVRLWSRLICYKSWESSFSFKKRERFKGWRGCHSPRPPLPSTTPSSIFLPRFVTFISFPCFSIANASVFGFDKSRAAKTILPRPFSSLRFPPWLLLSYYLPRWNYDMTWHSEKKSQGSEIHSLRSSLELEGICLSARRTERTRFRPVVCASNIFSFFFPFCKRKGKEWLFIRVAMVFSGNHANVI